MFYSEHAQNHYRYNQLGCMSVSVCSSGWPGGGKRGEAVPGEDMGRRYRPPPMGSPYNDSNRRDQAR